eukprot:scaffold9836_cov26-Tisochrysis_lutea.AAC.2
MALEDGSSALRARFNKRRCAGGGRSGVGPNPPRHAVAASHNGGASTAATTGGKLGRRSSMASAVVRRGSE